MAADQTGAPTSAHERLRAPLGSLALSVPFFLVSIDQHGVVQFATGGFLPVAGVDPHPGDDMQVVLASQTQLVAGLAAAVQYRQVCRVDVSAKGRVVDVLVEPVLDEAGGVAGAVAYGLEVTLARESAAQAAVLAQVAAAGDLAASGMAATMFMVARAVGAYTGAGVLITSSTPTGPQVVARWHRSSKVAAAVDQIAHVLTSRPQVTQAWTWATSLEVDGGQPEPLTSDVATREVLHAAGARHVLAWPLRTGEEIWGHLVLVTVPGSRDLVNGDSVRTFLSDISSRVALYLQAASLRTSSADAQAARAASDALFRSAFDSAPAGMFVARATSNDLGVLVAVNDTFATLAGAPAPVLSGRDLVDLLHAQDRDRVREGLVELVSGRRDRLSREVRLRRGDGELVWVRLTVGACSDDGPDAQIVGHVEDVTARRAARQELTRRAQFDDLTGLANRRQVLQRLGEVLTDAAPGHLVGVAFIDLDHFKQVNDTLGHDAGDQVLVEVATRLRHVVGVNDLPARLGGDEFVVVCPQLPNANDLHDVAHRVLTALAAPVAVTDWDGEADLVRTGASIGVAATVSPSTEPEDLLRAADEAMYAAKRAGRGRSRMELLEPEGALSC